MTLDQGVRSGLVLAQRFLQWWGAELAACVPARLRANPPWLRRPDVLLIGAREAAFGRERDDGGFEAETRLPPLGAAARTVPGAAIPVRLRLADDMALRLQIPLPKAASENLEEAVAFQLDRYTPFPPDQVYLSIAVRERAAGSDMMSVAVTVVERRLVADAIAHARRCGFLVLSVEVARPEGSGGPRADPLRVPELRSRSFGQSALAASAAVLLVALTAAAAIVPFARETGRAESLRQQVAAARGKADAVLRLEKANATAKAEASFLVDRKRDGISALDVLAELTRLAPDDTWLSSAAFSGTEVQISGFSGSASDLLGRIDTSRRFSKAQFRAPVTPDAKSGREHFVIAAEVEKGVAP